MSNADDISKVLGFENIEDAAQLATTARHDRLPEFS